MDSRKAYAYWRKVYQNKGKKKRKEHIKVNTNAGKPKGNLLCCNISAVNT